MTAPLPLFLLLLAQPAGPAPSPVPEELLRKLAEADARISRFHRESEVTLVSVTEELDGNGKVEHSEELTRRLAFRNGEEHHEVLRVSRDGKEISPDEWRKQQREGKTVRMGLTSPFGAEVQAGHAFHLLGPDARDPSLVRVSYRPREKPSKELWIGEAVVDPDRGEVRWMRQRPSELPAFTDRLEVVMDFGISTEAGRAISTARMEGEGGILFFRKRIRVLMRFTDWTPRKSPEPAPPPGK